MLKYTLIINIILSLSYGAIINVGSEEIHDFITIQEGIDNAEIGDTVLVHPGIYIENIILDKTITLTSLAIFDNLDNWFEYNNISNQFEVVNENINNTIIDGSNADFSNLYPFGSDDLTDYSGSSIFVGGFNDQCISPSIIGFTIQNGLGTMTQGPAWYGYYKKRGGGIFSYMSNTSINYNSFINNGTSDIDHGGAIYFQTDPMDTYISNGYNNFLSLANCEISEINIQNNFYNGNNSKLANTFASRFFSGDLHIDNSLFDVFNCSDTSFTKLWFDVQSEANIYYSGTQTNRCAANDDIWVSPSGIDSPESGNMENPLKTIKYALEIISPSLENNITIHLDEGIYSASETGDSFSLSMLSNTILKGAGRDLTILDGGTDDINPDTQFVPNSMILIEDCENNIISDLTIVRGVHMEHDNEGSAGGITLSNSDLKLINTNISANMGGGISAISSNLNITNTLISRNIGTSFNTGGILLYNTIANINNVTLTDNYASNGPQAIYIDEDSYLNMINSVVWNNNLLGNPTDYLIGGNYYYADGNVVNIFNSAIPNGWYGQQNIYEDPLFIDPEQGIDLDQQMWSPFGDYNLQGSSPCIDSGISFLELYGQILIDLDESEFLGEAPDMGCNEYYELILGDINSDELLNVLDVVMLVNLVLAGEYNYSGDVNQDGILNVLDVVILVNIVLNGGF